MKRLVILGITGSIGTQALECLDDIELVGASFHNNCSKMKEILEHFPHLKVFSNKNNSLNNVNSYKELLEQTQPDLVLNCVVGFDGLELSKLVIENDVDLALANKESLVVAGSLLIDLLKEHPLVHLYPVDSEHSSLYQLNEIDKDKVKTIYITASGGPFYHLDRSELETKTFYDAIKHPNWSMGYKISIDSATLINKCFELIEAHYLFPNKVIKGLYHPQSIVHALVEFKDNSVFANMSNPDMKIAINLALHKFEKSNPLIKPLSFKNLRLDFDELDENKFVPIAWAYEIMRTNNKAMGVIINTVNDFVIELFKSNRIKFPEIIEIISQFLNKYKQYPVNNWHDLNDLHEIINKELEELYC